MKKILVLAVATAITSMTMTGCAVKSGNEQLGKIEKNQLEASIIKGETTKSSVKSLLGDPDRTDFDNNSLEKWTYIHVRKDVKAVNYIPVANWFIAGTNDTTKTLVILFNDKGIVQNYINSDAKGETKGGLLQ